MSDYKVGTIILYDNGQILQRVPGGWDLLKRFVTLSDLDQEYLDRSEVIWEPSVLDGLLAGSIIQGKSVVAVKTPRNGWLITGEAKSGYTDSEIKKYFKGGIEVVKEVR